ncbi:MAG: radical SAM protein [Tissierellia bacterium]|nr:radical SAM protein [Tissierellia bacterium]
MAKRNIIPIFIPFYGCPSLCIYCNQRAITGQKEDLGLEELDQRIQEERTWFLKKGPIQVAFYGGTFTLLPFSKQKAYLARVTPWIQKGLIDGVRISTRPDAINLEELKVLRDLGLETVELGIQSWSYEVLRAANRPMDLDQVEKNIKGLKDLGFELGLQQMIGLPEDSLERSLRTQEKIISLGADFVRIYPTLVLDQTPLAQAYREGVYRPLDLDQAIDWTAQLLEGYARAHIPVIRVGLPPSQDLEDASFIAGPKHAQFRELATSRWWTQKLGQLIEDKGLEGQICLEASQANINRLVGPRAYGKAYLSEAYPIDLSFKNMEGDKMVIRSHQGDFVWDLWQGVVDEIKRT